MFNLFDILQSQSSPGMQAIGQQFGLSPDQSRRAAEVLLPALAAGLQRSATSDPMGFGRFLGFAGAGPFVPGQPQPPQPDLLTQLLGASPLNHAVLQQAAAASGIGTQALRQMLPVMAGMVVAGIVHILINQPPASYAPPVRQEPPPAPAGPGLPIMTFWNDWLSGMLGNPTTTASGRPTGQTETSPRRPAATAGTLPAPKEPSATQDKPFEAFEEMFRSGVQVQEQNAKAMQDIFDAFWSAPPGRSGEPGAVVDAATARPEQAEDRPDRTNPSRATERGDA